MSTLCPRYKFSSILRSLSSLSHLAQARLLVFHHPIYTVKQESLKTLANYLVKRCEPLTLAFHMNYCSIMLMNCWKCETHLPRRTFFCDKCNTLQPVDYKLDHFEVMGIERTFDIDADLLAKNFKKLQIQFHPDKFSLKSQKEHQMAVEHSTVINSAYRCLQQPVERALYLLDLAGKPLHEGQIWIQTF
ncbi:hypothetical protein OTU49_006114 [Cherax quadricarinatus]|uniref:J domain-containing protein n=1 Tax=Cherax quadricarinatus TaxID=27406 RepID=A0AAW0X3U0_CHEQU